MFVKSAAFYDAIYGFKDYAAEADLLHALISQYMAEVGATLLDAACGTGKHLAHLGEYYAVEGFDLDAGLLKIARERLPNVPLHLADMTDFSLGKRYHVVTCLFSAIGYAVTEEKLFATLKSFAAHLHSGGVALVEPWIFPEQFKAGHLGALYVDQPDLKIARINQSSAANGVSTLHFHYLVGTPEGVSYFTEDHALGLFTDAQYRAAFAAAGLETHFDAHGVDGRGMYIGIKP